MTSAEKVSVGSTEIAKLVFETKMLSVTVETLLSIYCDYILCKFATMDTETLVQVNHT